MALLSRNEAVELLASRDWLSLQPAPFRDEILRRFILMRFEPGQYVYRYGDPPGGIYGLVSGTLSVNSAAVGALPQTVHLGIPGAWTGEGCFLTRGTRMLELQALVELQMAHVPLDVMDQMAAANPDAYRCFAGIMVKSLDVVIQVIDDLLKPQVNQRIAAVLARAARVGMITLPLSQTDIANMANASRKQVNAALQFFAAQGWIETGYRAIRVQDSNALQAYARNPPQD